MKDQDRWEAGFIAFLATAWAEADAGHDLLHIRRVVRNAKTIAAAEGADLAVVVPAAWLHDCVAVAKDSADRHAASRLSAERARTYLRSAGYPARYLSVIAHAIEAHSFTANVTPTTLEAQVVQDADRLDAIGAIGIARTIAVGTQLGRPLYHAAEPFPVHREADDRISTVDHFYTKLLRIAATMQTDAGRALATERSNFMIDYLSQLGKELGNTIIKQ